MTEKKIELFSTKDFSLLLGIHRRRCLFAGLCCGLCSELQTKLPATLPILQTGVCPETSRISPGPVQTSRISGIQAGVSSLQTGIQARVQTGLPRPRLQAGTGLQTSVFRSCLQAGCLSQA